MNLRVFGRGAGALECGAGHALREFEVVARSVGDFREWNHVVHGLGDEPLPGLRAVLHDGDLLLEEHERTELVREGRRVLRRTRHALVPVLRDGSMLVWTHCRRCRPIWVEGGFGSDGLEGVAPFVEFELRLAAGRVVQVRPVVHEDRDALRERLARGGAAVVSDRDRAVRRRRAAARDRSRP